MDFIFKGLGRLWNSTSCRACLSLFLSLLDSLACLFLRYTSTNLSHIVTDKGRTSVLQTLTVIERWNGHIFQVLRGPLRTAHQKLPLGIPGNGRERHSAPTGSKCRRNKMLVLSNVVYWQLNSLWYENSSQIGPLLILTHTRTHTGTFKNSCFHHENVSLKYYPLTCGPHVIASLTLHRCIMVA